MSVAGALPPPIGATWPGEAARKTMEHCHGSPRPAACMLTCPFQRNEREVGKQPRLNALPSLCATSTVGSLWPAKPVYNPHKLFKLF